MRTYWPSEVDALALRQEVRVTIVSAEQYDPDFPPSRLLEFSSWLEAIVDEIPEEHRPSAEIEISSVGSYYDSHYGQIEVTYRRPETDAEWETRKADVMRRVRDAEEAQRREYEALKQKFEA